MAGTIRVAAKLILGTTVLAAGGGGGYYYHTHGLTLPAFTQSPTAPSDADLAAVASAWAEPPKSHLDDPSLSSPIARSAKPEAATTDTKMEKSPVGDRYAATAAEPSQEPVTAEVASDTKTKDDVKAEERAVVKSETPVTDKSGAAAEPEPTQVVDTEPAAEKPAADETRVPTIATPAAETAVARGQEPKDEPAAPISNSTADLEATLNASGGASAALAEPKPLTPPAQSSDISAASAQAKAAFGNPPNATTTDRYSNSAAAPRSAQAPSNNGQIVNPFSVQPQPTPAAAKSNLIEPLPASPVDAGDGFDSPAPSRGGLQPMQGSNSASSMGSASSMNREVPPTTRPISSAPRAGMGAPYDRSMPSSNNLSSNPEPITPIPAGDGAGKPGEKALEGLQQPTLVIQKFAPGEIQVGKPAKFVVQVRNAGAQSADDVTVRDEIPQGTKLISTSPNASTEGGAIVWKLGKLSPGEDRTVEMQLMPTTEGEIGSVATVYYSAQASVKTKCTMPQLAIRMTAANEVMIGNQQHVKIEIKNPGTGDATHVMLFENVPPNVKHAAGPALEFEIGTLHPGETRELDLVLTAEKAGKVVNALTARADGSLQVQQQVEFEVIAPALTVDVNGPERRYLERPATYEVSVVNPGTAPAHDVQIVTKLPKGMKFVRANNMGEYDAATHAVYWSLAELPKGERGTVEVVAMPTETGQQTLQVEGHAQQGLTDHKQRDITVEGLAAIMFEVRDLEDPIEVGGETVYEIRVVNQGTKAATNVQVTCEIPPGMKVLSAEGEAAHKVMDSRLVFEPLQQLAPKADTVYRIRAQGLQAGDQRITVQVNTDDLQQPIRREESTRVFGDQ